MTHATAQLQEQLLGAQADAEEAHAAAKLKQIEHESQSQQLTEVCSSSRRFSFCMSIMAMSGVCAAPVYLCNLKHVHCCLSC